MAITFRLSVPDPGAHRLRVEVRHPGGPAELLFPAWTPGSYLMREFVRNVRELRVWAEDGAPVRVDRPERHRWRVAHPGPFRVAYEVYCHEKSVRTPYVDASLVFFVPGNVLLYDETRRDEGFVVELDVPAGHTGVCALGAPVAGPARARWEAGDVDVLMDAPVAVGPFQHTSFTVDGIEHHHWVEPGHNGDLERMNRDLERLVVAAARTVGELPYRRYDFVTLHLAKGHGGLEHKDCSVLLKSRLSFRSARGYEDFLALAAHEHFHAWNVKRIHPDALGPRFRYDREHYTHDLWWLEGATEYYEERILYRSGGVDADRHLARLAGLVERLSRLPGRRRHPLEESSFEAWIKLYRPGEDSPNSTISYYLKGAVVLLAADLELLHRTRGERGLDEVLRALWNRWGSRGVGYPEGTLEVVMAEVAGGGGDWWRWWTAHVRGTAEVQLVDAFDHAGFDLAWEAAAEGAWLGVEVGGGERVVVEGVREDGPSWGRLSPGDELLAIDGHRILGPGLADRLADLPPRVPAHVLLARDGRVTERVVTPTTAPPKGLKIVARTGIDQDRQRVRDAWLTRTSPPPAPPSVT